MQCGEEKEAPTEVFFSLGNKSTKGPRGYVISGVHQDQRELSRSLIDSSLPASEIKIASNHGGRKTPACTGGGGGGGGGSSSVERVAAIHDSPSFHHFCVCTKKAKIKNNNNHNHTTCACVHIHTYHTPTLLVFIRAATFARGDSLEFAEDGGETITVEAADVSEPGLTFEFQGARVRCCTYVMGSAYSCHFSRASNGGR